MTADQGLSQVGVVRDKLEQRGNSSSISERKSVDLGDRWLWHAVSVYVCVLGDHVEKEYLPCLPHWNSPRCRYDN